MRHYRGTWVSCALLAMGCSSPQVTATPTVDSGVVVGCGGDAAGCLMGTVTSTAFGPPLVATQVELHRVFPGGLASPVATQATGDGGAWAFGGVPAWGHYYVRVVGTFDLQSGVTRIVGPLSVPSDAGPLVVDLEPVSVTLLESRGQGGALQLVSAVARVFDPTTGSEIVDGGATVTIAVGDASVGLPWNGVPSDTPEYGVEPSPPPPAQPSYVVSVSTSGDAGAPTQWTLVADPPQFDGTILTLGAGAAGATAVARQPLTPRWTAPPQAMGPMSCDYVTVELFESDGGAYALQYVSPNPESPDTTQESIAGSFLPDPAPYLLDVAYTKANCALAAAGCVHASAVAAVAFDAGAPLASDGGTADASGD